MSDWLREVLDDPRTHKLGFAAIPTLKLADHCELFKTEYPHWLGITPEFDVWVLIVTDNTGIYWYGPGPVQTLCEGFFRELGSFTPLPPPRERYSAFFAALDASQAAAVPKPVIQVPKRTWSLF